MARILVVTVIALAVFWIGWRLCRYLRSRGCGGATAPLRIAALRPSLSSGADTDRLAMGESLAEGQMLKSPNGKYAMVMQGDGNLVVYGDLGTSTQTVVWASNSQKGASTDAARFAVQDDYNLVVYAGNTAVWSSNTYLLKSKIPGPITIVLQDDGNVILYGQNAIVWSSMTGLFCPATVVADDATLYPLDNPTVRPPTIPGVDWGTAPDDLANYIGNNCTSIVQKYRDHFHMNQYPNGATFGDAAKPTSLRLDVIAYVLRNDPNAAYINWAYALINDFGLHIAPGFSDERPEDVMLQYGLPILAPPLPVGNGGNPAANIKLGYLATYVYRQYLTQGDVLFHPDFMSRVYGWTFNGTSWAFTERTPVWAIVRLLRFIDHEGWTFIDRIALARNIMAQFKVEVGVECTTSVGWRTYWENSVLPLADPIRGTAAKFIMDWINKHYPESQRQPPMQTFFDRWQIQPWRTVVNLVKQPNVCLFQWMATVAPTPWTDLINGAPDGAWFMPLVDVYQPPFAPYSITYFPQTGLLGYWDGAKLVDPGVILPANMRAYIEAFALRGIPKTDKAAFARIIIDFYQIDVHNPATTSSAAWVINKAIPVWCLQQIIMVKDQVLPAESRAQWCTMLQQKFGIQ
jgi:hypothetical protein